MLLLFFVVFLVSMSPLLQKVVYVPKQENNYAYYDCFYK